MKLSPALGAGSAFGGAALVGGLVGAWMAARSGQSLWFLVGFSLGLLVGAALALRLLLREAGK